jgi:hypothetical protein
MEWRIGVREQEMARKKYRVEEIIGKLREAEVELGRAYTVVDVCR